MNRTARNEWLTYLSSLLVPLLVFVLFAAFCMSCRTVGQIQQTPEEVWISLWLIGESLVMDAVDLVTWVMGAVL